MHRLELTLSEKLKALEIAQHLIENQREKLSVHQDEFIKLETRCEKEILRLECDVSNLQNKLTVYEDMESQLDEVIMELPDDGKDGIMGTVLHSIPTHPKRRVRQ